MIYRRFYRLPEGVKVRLDPIYHRLDGTRTFAAIGQRTDKFARAESVVLQVIEFRRKDSNDDEVYRDCISGRVFQGARGLR
jgi:hypothetical protein